ncbi:MAG: hypothetical protein U5K84_10385 [Alkalibacterium sp.]|nr:hypothetical protein [Alkalibacterium sp.]
MSDGPAPDGEEFFAMTLFMASKRWGDRMKNRSTTVNRQGTYFESACTKARDGGAGDPMWEPKNHLIKFVPDCDFTDTVLSPAAFL